MTKKKKKIAIPKFRNKVVVKKCCFWRMNNNLPVRNRKNGYYFFVFPKFYHVIEYLEISTMSLCFTRYESIWPSFYLTLKPYLSSVLTKFDYGE